MTLDEAIKHCEEKAKELKNQYGCLACAEEHEQLARWLRELKWRREAEEQ